MIIHILLLTALFALVIEAGVCLSIMLNEIKKEKNNGDKDKISEEHKAD